MSDKMDEPALVINLDISVGARCCDCDPMVDQAEAAAFAEIIVCGGPRKHVCRAHLHVAMKQMGLID